MRFYSKAAGLTLLYLSLFFFIFFQLQKTSVYNKTLGKISQNYEHKADAGPYDIQKVSKPYTSLSEENYERWDAAIYKCIRDRMYIYEEGYYGFVRGAFFPLFPLLWKISHLGSTGISILNFICFALGIMLIVNGFSKTTSGNKLMLFLLMLSLPNSVIFIIPYTEALFVLSGGIVFTGILRNNYRIYFIGALLMAMTRPATLFFFISVVCVEIILFAINRNGKLFAKGLLQKLLPFFLGYFISVLIQFLYSGSWTTYVDAQSHWEGKFGIPSRFSDWSIEGFGLSVFAICFVAFPSLLYLCYFILRKQKSLTDMGNEFRFFSHSAALNYSALISLFYVGGMLLFSLLTSGGSLHGFFRFVLCSPAFYLLVVYASNNLIKKNSFIPLLAASLLFYLAFLFSTEYGGNRSNFSFFGSYLIVFNCIAIIILTKFNNSLKYILTITLLFFNLVWNTYMFNIFLSDGWIFT